MSDTSAYGDGIRDDDTLVDDDNSSVRSFGSVSTVVWKGANPSLPNRSRSYWQDHTPLPPLDDIKISSDIPDRVDVVIIGSGMTGVGVALSFLQLMASKGKFPVVLVIEAGEICSGATARTSGYIKFLPHINTHDGQLLPTKVLDLQVKNAQALKELASRYPHAHAREFETEELHFYPADFEDRKAVVTDLNGFMDLNEQYRQYKVTILEGDKVPNYGHLPACGALSYKAASIQPYHLVTSIWGDLCRQYANLRISTNNSVEKIELTTDSSHPYRVTCSRGTLQARHVVHATGSWATRLLPALEISLAPGLVHVVSQRPGASFPQHGAKHSWTLNTGNLPFTVIRLPDGNDEIGELLIERGWMTTGDMNDVEMQDTWKYLHYRMRVVFGPEWLDEEIRGTLYPRAVGMTGDYLPFVGRIPREYANREVLRSDQAAVEAAVSEDGGLATPGEWISAGYNGQETAFALLSGHAVGIQIAGMEDEELEMLPGRPGGRLNDWFPKEELSLDGDRVMRANLGPLN
ncbi:FAD dependent oxidoreductase, partial [Metarhizium majus ARSEF 297]